MGTKRLPNGIQEESGAKTRKCTLELGFPGGPLGQPSTPKLEGMEYEVMRFEKNKHTL